MFDFIPNTLTSLLTILLPTFLSYKALLTTCPALLAPWLIYWTTLSLLQLLESQLYFILAWVPFYAWLRLGLRCYLLLPTGPGGEQGSVVIYEGYIRPFLAEYEGLIDSWVEDAHIKIKQAGGDAAKRTWEWLRGQNLGEEGGAKEVATPAEGVGNGYGSYTSQLMARFALPSFSNSTTTTPSPPAQPPISIAGTTTTTTTADMFAALGKALQQYTSTSTSPGATSREAQIEDLTRSGTLVPPSLAGEERRDFISVQRERLRTLIMAFDREASDEATATATTSIPSPSADQRPQSGNRRGFLAPLDDEKVGAMHRSPSESDFEILGEGGEGTVDSDSFRPQLSTQRMRLTASPEKPGWSSWIWGSYGKKDSALASAATEKGKGKGD